MGLSLGSFSLSRALGAFDGAFEQDAAPSNNVILFNGHAAAPSTAQPVRASFTMGM